MFVDIQLVNLMRISFMKCSVVCLLGGMCGLVCIDEWMINVMLLKVLIILMIVISGGGGDGVNMCVRCIVVDVMFEKVKMIQLKV